MKKKLPCEPIEIKMPFVIIPSEFYHLILLDANGFYHYFTRDKYDGWGRDLYPENTFVIPKITFSEN